MSASNQLEKTVYVVNDLCQLLSIGRDKAYRIMGMNSFPSMRIGRKYVVSKKNFEKWLDENAGKIIQIDTEGKD